jgi:hypothetical protein
MQKIAMKADLNCIESETMKRLATSEFQKLLASHQIYDPEQDGYLLILEKSDSEQSIQQLFSVGFYNILWEGFHKEHGCFVGVVLFNNQFALTVIVPDEAWLNPLWRQVIISNMEA